MYYGLREIKNLRILKKKKKKKKSDRNVVLNKSMIIHKQLLCIF